MKSRTDATSSFGRTLLLTGVGVVSILCVASCGAAAPRSAPYPAQQEGVMAAPATPAAATPAGHLTLRPPAAPESRATPAARPPDASAQQVTDRCSGTSKRPGPGPLCPPG